MYFDVQGALQALKRERKHGGLSIGDIADHVDGVIRQLDKKPAVIGHSFGGLLVQIVAGRFTTEPRLLTDWIGD